MQLYKVKLLEGHSAKKEQIVNGYLAGFDTIGIYTRGEAIKKASMFGGKIEKHGKNYVGVEQKVLSLSKSQISSIILNEMYGCESHKDTDEDLSENVYYGDIFTDILNKESVNAESGTMLAMSNDLLDELRILETLTQNYAYIILVP